MPQPPLHFIPVNSFRDLPFSNDKSHVFGSLTLPLTPQEDVYHYGAIAFAHPVSDGDRKFVTRNHPVLRRQHEKLGGQARATLPTTVGDYRTTGTGTHPHAETVHLVATAIIRLVSTLSHSILLAIGQIATGKPYLIRSFPLVWSWSRNQDHTFLPLRQRFDSLRLRA